MEFNETQIFILILLLLADLISLTFLIWVYVVYYRPSLKKKVKDDHVHIDSPEDGSWF